MDASRAVLSILALALALETRAAAEAAPALSTSTVAAAPAQERRGVLFYSDLGADRIDVDAYPETQRRNYAVYARACSRCHSLARSVNAPYTSRGWWEFYMTGMRLRGRASGRPFSREEISAVLDFLEYDSRVRKVENAAAFDASTVELKRRFDQLIDHRMSDLQNKPQPRLIPGER